MDSPKTHGSRPPSTLDEKPAPETAGSSDAIAPRTVTPPPEKNGEEENYPTGAPLFLICFGLFLAVLCLGLDRTIISTAIPKITSNFNSLPDIGWYGSAYLLTACCFQLGFGKLYAELAVKWVFLCALVIFEVGSVVCAAAPSSAVLIAGRAIAGLGCAGLLSGALVIIAQSVPLRNRPRVTGLVAGGMGIGQIIAPTLGGVFTDYVTWRWCFWINLPLGAVTFAVVALFVRVRKMTPRGPDGEENGGAGDKDARKSGFWYILRRFDVPGTLLLLPALVSLLLALQWGGTEYAWGSWRVILTLAVFGLCSLVWGFVQYRAGDDATVPVRIIGQRSVASAMWFIFCLMGVMMAIILFMPVWFQSSKGVSAYQSGINLLAMTLTTSVMVIASGFLTTKIGYYVPQMIVGTVLMSIGTGLISRLDLDTTTAYWAGSLVLVGIGFGISGQQPLMIPQTMLSGSDIALGTSLIVFTQTLSGTLWVSVANNVFHDRLVAELGARAPGVDPQVVVAAGASDIAQRLGPIYPGAIGEILAAYSAALQRLWLIPLVLGCLSVFGVVFVEWRSVKGDKKKESEGEASEAEASGVEGGEGGKKVEGA